MGLVGKRVLVAGGSSGIGLATAQCARAAGALVVTASRRPADVSQPGTFEHIAVDLASERDVREKLGGLPPFDHLVVTAGGAAPGKFRGGDAGAGMAAFETKFWGAWHAAAHVPLTDAASITFISGVFAERPAKRNVAACCVNAALEGLARALAVELAPMRVNAVSPGLVDTPMWHAMPEDRRAAYFDSVAKTLPAGRICAPEDVAAMVLACMTNPVLTGTVLKVDGGFTLV